jgi:hypothetical protein
MMNPAKLLKLKNSWDIFSGNHPKFPSYLNAVKNTALVEGTIIEINVTTAEGKSLKSNLKLTKSDIDLLHDLSKM